METNKIWEDKITRLYSFPPDSINAFVRIRRIYPNGDIYASNTDFDGNINKVFSKEHFEKLQSK